MYFPTANQVSGLVWKGVDIRGSPYSWERADGFFMIGDGTDSEVDIDVLTEIETIDPCRISWRERNIKKVARLKRFDPTR